MAATVVEKHNCCINTRAIIDYIARQGGQTSGLVVGLEKHLSGVPDPIEFLRDPHNWVSSDVCRIMYENARRITGDPQVAFAIGFESVAHQSLGYVTKIFMRALATPKAAISRAEAINQKFNRNKRVEVVDIRRESAVVRLHWYKDITLSKHFCLMNQGVYSALSTLFGVPPARVEETQCQMEGAEYCEYRVTWRNPSLLHRIRHLTGQRGELLTDSLAELEYNKRLLEDKYQQIQELNAHLQQKIDQLISVHEASTAILSQLDLTRLMNSVLHRFMRTINYDRAMIMLVDEELGELRFVEGVGIDPEEKVPLLGYAIPLHRRQNLLARVAKSGRPFVCDDTTALNLNPDNVIIRNYRPTSIVVLPLVVRGRVIGILAADRAVRGKASAKTDREFLRVFANQVALAIENARMYQNLRQGAVRTMRSLALALEAKDPYTRGHSERVSLFSERLARRLDLGSDLVEHIRTGCHLHDIGKIGVGGDVLRKKEPLTPQDWQVIRRHPMQGYQIVEPLDLSGVESAIVRHHHERYDGQGYPDGLAGDGIPLAVRVVTVCDAFDAMTSDRPYRRALRVGESLSRLEEGAGTQFDPRVVNIFVTMARQGELSDLLTVPQGRGRNRLPLDPVKPGPVLPPGSEPPTWQ